MGGDEFGGHGAGEIAADEVDRGGRAGATGGLDGEAEQLGAAGGLERVEEHRLGGIEHDVDHRADFLAVELHRVLPGSGEGGPVDVPGIVAGDVGPVVLEIEG